MRTTVETRHGRLEGTRAGGEIAFRGVPYAAPPLAARRWAPPAPPEPWSGVRRAVEFAPAAPQLVIELETLPILDIGVETNEDCLYLNVWTPGCDAARRPVMVWIHGGGFTIGTGAQLVQDAMPLVEHGDVVVVSINYRLGLFGFLRLDEATEGAIPASGNEGLLDQIAALRWVRENIAAFGGDPNNVTIFGESAGGMSVGTLMALPPAEGLFHRAIPQSGAASTASTRDRATQVAGSVLSGLGTHDADALRALPVERLLEAQAKLLPAAPGGPESEFGTMPLQPVVDGRVLPGPALERIAAGSAAGIPVLVGSTLDEWKLFGMLDPSTLSLDEPGLLRRLEALPDPATLVAAYRKARAGRQAPTTPRELLMAIETDRAFRIPGLRLAEAQRAHEARVYSYLVTWPSPMMGGILGSPHAVELGPLFGIHDTDETTAAFFGRGPAADELARGMQEAWTRFARSGDPSGPVLGDWPAYEPEQRATMILGEASHLERAPYDDERRAWEGIPDQLIGKL
ncbi:MAG: carboxylesterase/lipase family protein [Myxococcales bacterium]|nr:carboxylesterase/lipase family protein [Myxococcales bacterium]